MGTQCLFSLLFPSMPFSIATAQGLIEEPIKLTGVLQYNIHLLQTYFFLSATRILHSLGI